ncbi:PH domain-containing protein [Georgenia halophila]|uniref:PH domain-containing protein n=1 Tax=Georgenia halophila TaxID=620889 RepID=A0ABP8KYB9_9MICO
MPPDPAQPVWRSVHKITPILNAWKVVVAVVVATVWQLGDELQNIPEVWERFERYRTTALLIILGIVLVVAVVAGIYSWLAWRRMKFAVTSESVDLHSGILFRRQRHARLVRVQAVDVVQPLLGRIFGLGQVKVETAGGNESNVIIGYLKEAEAQALRNEVMARAAGVAGPPAGQAPGGQPSGGQAHAEAGAPDDASASSPLFVAAPERQMLHVPAGRLVGSLVLSPVLIFFILFIVGLGVAAYFAGSAAPIFGTLPALLGWVAALWGRFAGEFHFRVAISPDGIRLRHGLLESRSQTLPPGRVQAVQLTQPLLWRPAGWWRVRINVAGYGAAEGSGGNVETVLLPVGPRGDALTALWLVLPDLGVADPRAVLDAALDGSGEAGGFRTSPRRARWLDPLTWRRNALFITGTALLIRSGRWTRNLVVVPHERTQSLALEQGPLERRCRIANLHAHSVSGPVTPVVFHLDEMLARHVLVEQAARARTARAAEGPEEWMRRVEAAGAVHPPAADGPQQPSPGGTAAP